MKIAVTKYNLLHREFTVTLILLAIVILFAAKVKNENSFTSRLAGIEELTYENTLDAAEVIKHDAPAQNSDLLVRAKAFFNTLPPSSTFAIQLYPIYADMQYAVRVLCTQKPEYYGFLFRYTPF
jgi:hypothetical protein